MGGMYVFSAILGYFLVMLIFCVLAIIFAKGKLGWILYFVGAGIQLVSLIGRQKSFGMFGMGSAMSTYWIAYFIILAVVAIIVHLRRSEL